MAASQPRQARGRKRLIERRILIAVGAFVFLGTAVVLWILNTQQIIQGSWSNALSIIFTFTGVLIGLLQWLFPVTPDAESRQPIVSAHTSLLSQAAGGLETRAALTPIILQVPSTVTTPLPQSSTDAGERASYRGILGMPPPTDPRTIQQREQAVQEIYACLIQPVTSAVVLTGIGGVGKSTLAALVYSYAEAQRQEGLGPFTGPAIWLNIDPAVTMGDLAGNLCEVFGKPLPDFSNLSLPHQALALFNILNTPGEARLLVLDQFENLLDWQTGHALADRPGVGEWLDALNSQPCRSRILMTTRPWPLGTREYPPTCMQKYIVTGLAVDEGADLLRKLGVSADAQALRTLVERCGGHAFALTLLASLLRNRNLTLSAFFNDSSYAHVWTGNVARNLLDKIYTSQLNDIQRQLLLGFSVYREPVSLDAARVLCDFASGVSIAQIQQALDALLAQHLLQAMGDGTYQLHAIVEDYARDEQANRKTLYAAHDRAAQYYMRLAANNYAARGRRESLSDYDPLIEASWQFCKAQQWRKAYDLITRENLFAGLKALGGLAILLELYKMLLPLKNWQATPLEGARIYNRLGSVSRSLGRRELATRYLEQALALCKAAGEMREFAWSLNHLGRLYTSMGEKERASAYYEEALARARANGDRVLEAASLNNLGWIYSAWEKKELEHKYYEDALKIYREIHEPHGEAATLNNLGRVAEDLGEYENAQQYYTEALHIFQEIGARRGAGWSLNNLGRSYFLAGDQACARAYLEESLSIRREVDRKGEGRTLNNLGAIYAEEGDSQRARECYQEALEITSEITDREGRGKILRNIGLLYLAQKNYTESLAFLLTARSLLDSLQSPGREKLQEYMNRLYQKVGDEEFMTLLSQVEPRAEALVEQILKAWSLP